MKEENNISDHSHLSEYTLEGISDSHKFPFDCMTPEAAYERVRRENSNHDRCRLDVGTFVTTHVDKYAARIMSETANLNYACGGKENTVIQIAGKCINMLADLWNNNTNVSQHSGAPTIGSTEARMLAGAAALIRWRDDAAKNGRDAGKPNFVISAARHEAWDRFARLWQVEMRVVELNEQTKTLDSVKAVTLCDDNTFMVVAIAGDTYSGLNDNVELLDSEITKFNRSNSTSIPIHVDAAIGGFILPFLYPHVKWDFRLRNVCSINTSSHKFGLVYAGLGWVVWRSNYYSIDPCNTVADSFHSTRPSAQILAQYYQFLRLGFEGYRAIMNSCMEVASYACRRLNEMECFLCLSDHIESPFFSWRLDPNYAREHNWRLTDLQQKLQDKGWNINQMTLPYDKGNREILRLVFRRGMGMDLADRLLSDIRESVYELERLEAGVHTVK